MIKVKYEGLNKVRPVIFYQYGIMQKGEELKPGDIVEIPEDKKELIERVKATSGYKIIETSKPKTQKNKKGVD